MQDDRRGIDEVEFILAGEVAQAGMKHSASPPSWWAQAWRAFEPKMDEQTHKMTDQMERMFSIQPQRMASLEARFEMEASRTRTVER